MLAALKNRWNRPVMNYVDSPADVGGALSTVRHGYKLWDYLLFVVLLVALFEPWLANRISARLYGRPQATPAIGLVGVGRNGRTRPQSSPEVQPLEGSRR